MHSRQTLRQSSSIRHLYQSTRPCPIALPRRSSASVKSLDCQTRLSGLCLGKRQKMTTAAAAAPEQAAPQHAHNHQQRQLSYTAYEGNSWQATLPATGLTVLVDPWLEGDLTFGEQAWLYTGKKGRLADVALNLKDIEAQTDVILLSQGLDDHAHKPTLRKLRKDIPVVGSPAAAAVARQLGFETVHAVDHWQTLELFEGRLRFQGVPGALVGPPWSKRENGFVVREAGGVSMYYEPHCDAQASELQRLDPVDIIVTPAVSQMLVSFPLVKGATENLIDLVRALQPSIVIPLINAEFNQSGPLSWLIKPKGSVEELEQRLRHAGLQRSRVQMPAAPGQPFTVNLA